jgi:hypothetical protein
MASIKGPRARESLPAISSPSRDIPDRMAVLHSDANGDHRSAQMVPPHADFAEIYTEGFLLPEGHKHSLPRDYVPHIPGPMDNMSLDELMKELVDNCQIGGAKPQRRRASPLHAEKARVVRRRQLIERYTRKRRELLELRNELLTMDGELAPDDEDSPRATAETVEALSANGNVLKKELRAREAALLVKDTIIDGLEKRLEASSEQNRQLKHSLQGAQRLVKLGQKREVSHTRYQEEWAREIKAARSEERKSDVGLALQEKNQALLRLETELAKSQGQDNALSTKVLALQSQLKKEQHRLVQLQSSGSVERIDARLAALKLEEEKQAVDERLEAEAAARTRANEAMRSATSIQNATRVRVRATH